VGENWSEYFLHTGEGKSGGFLEAMNHTVERMTAILSQARSPYSGLDPEFLDDMINSVDLDRGNVPLKDVISDAVELIAKNSILVQHPHCIAHLHTPPLVSAVAAEVIIAMLNQSMDSWDQASAATYVEQKVVDWACARFGLGSESDGIFTSGGTQSNQMGLLLARDWIAHRIDGHSIQKEGLPAYASKLRIICSRNAHFTVVKAASWMGLGERAVITVDVLPSGGMDVSQLDSVIEETTAAGLIPFAVVGTAGTTDHGAIDDLSAIADCAEKSDLWFHVDSAYGGALILSGQKDRLRGIERASSVSVDFHKLFFQTISCGACLIKDKGNLRFLLHHSDYLNREHDTLPNLVDKSLATTKRFDALKVYMTMQSVGPDRLGAMADHLVAQAREVAALIKARDGFELLAEPSLSTVLFRLKGKPSGDADGLNQRVRMEALTRGLAVLGETRIHGKSALKFTILNPCLDLADFGELLDKIEALGDELTLAPLS
jgi:diaminobutyrate-2-oxoglutarate transaminase